MKTESDPYSEQFFASIASAADTSARVLVPALMRDFTVESVIDVGCGTGHWLKAFAENGISLLVGVDTSGATHAQNLLPQAKIHSCDLNAPLALEQTFDLAICLEVAEHLPCASGDQLVDSLTDLAPLVLFSAAVPGQGGTNHLNEQWPRYWARRFAQRGYGALSTWRLRWWEHPEVVWWYAQNIVIYVRKDWHDVRYCQSERPAFEEVQSLVHPELFRRRCADLEEATVRTISSSFADLRRAVIQRLRRLSGRSV